MVSFTCNRCQDVVKKPKVFGHSNTCGSSSFTCVDCMELFDLNSVKHHTSCITEVDKYQGQWKQKCSVNGNPKRPQERGDDSDGDDKSARQRLHPPRPRMNNLSDSDSDDSDWVHTKKSNTSSSTMKQKKKGMSTMTQNWRLSCRQS
ncbi:unnamed protein product [Phytomonas sp. EM1]|nr:unnamed protein product [Phytomonas sp. EM1]|eukprot:CCW59649.1 unnamed protein product [Phytomonas sp. isolate EM1]